MCSAVTKNWPGSITIEVTERHIVAAYRRLGSAYLLDSDGMVMETCELTDVPDQLPIIIGFDVVSVNVGQKLAVRTSTQMEAYCEILKQIDVNDGITRIDLKTPTDIYIDTAYNVTLRVGDSSYMHAKIAAYRTDMAYLRQLNTAGVLDLTTP